MRVGSPKAVLLDAWCMSVTCPLSAELDVQQLQRQI